LKILKKNEKVIVVGNIFEEPTYLKEILKKNLTNPKKCNKICSNNRKTINKGVKNAE
jgi:hypothetical protein